MVCHFFWKTLYNLLVLNPTVYVTYGDPFKHSDAPPKNIQQHSRSSDLDLLEPFWICWIFNSQHACHKELKIFREVNTISMVSSVPSEFIFPGCFKHTCNLLSWIDSEDESITGIFQTETLLLCVSAVTCDVSSSYYSRLIPSTWIWTWYDVLCAFSYICPSIKRKEKKKKQRYRQSRCECSS